MMTEKFHKFSGAGNTFVCVLDDVTLIETRRENSLDQSELARRLCDRQNGAGVDGVLFLSPSGEPFDFRWDFFNADGSTAQMCGNAARCAGLYVEQILHRTVPSREVRFSTGAGPVRVRKIDENIFSTEMPIARLKNGDHRVVIGGKTYQGTWIDTGVPHFVISNLLLEDLPAEICRRIRFHESFGEEGANVTWLSRENAKQGCAKTYERGVEDFTLACGTGAVAAAWVLTEGSGQGPVIIAMPGGELRVEWRYERPILTGPAIEIGVFEATKEFYR